MFRTWTFLPAVVSLFLPAGAARAELPPLIPREVLFGNPVKASPQVSPDGKRLAYVAPDKKNVLQVWVQTLGKDDARQVTNDRKRGIRIHRWTYAPDTLLYLQDNDGDENFHVYAVNLADKVVRDLTPFQGVRAEIVGLDRNFPNELLVGLNVKNPRLHDVYRVDLTTGAVALDTKNPGDVLGWDVDPKFRVRAAQASTPDGGMEVRYRADEKSPWKTVVKWGPDDAEGRLVGFNAAGDALWLVSSEGRDTLALVKRNLETGKEEVVAADKQADAGNILFNPNTHTVEAVAFNRERVRWQAIDPTVADDLAALRKGAPGEPSVVSRDRDQKTWVVAYSADLTPTTYYLYDRPTKKLTKLFAAQPKLEDYTLAPMKPVIIKSRDGLELVCYLTLPVGVEAKGLPLVLNVHGGPWARDSWGYNATAQWLANRGYAVLEVNYRGSTGFGKKFLHAGDREWAGKMHDDLIDAVNWAVKQGYADAKRVAIFGGSYGGYAALVGVTFTPDVFACAVDIVGPSNLVTLLKSIPPYWEPMKKMLAVRVGDLDKEEEFLRSRSPLFKANRIKVPLLIAQGANDPRVKQAESEQIVQAMRQAGKPVEYLLFADEGHGFARPENRLKFFGVAEAFLAKHLGGGRVEPAAADAPRPAAPPPPAGRAEEKPAADAAATKLLADARAARATWENFPGFRADVEVNLDGKVTRGEVEVSAEGEVTLRLEKGAAADWARPTLRSIVGHRLDNSADLDTPCAFLDDNAHHPLGRAIRVLNDEFHSSYRIRDRQVIVVNRALRDTRFTITVLENRLSAEKKFLPVSYVVNTWAAEGGALRGSAAHHQTWQRVGRFDLPHTATVVTASAGKLEARGLTLSNFRLLPGQKE